MGKIKKKKANRFHINYLNWLFLNFNHLHFLVIKKQFLSNCNWWWKMDLLW